MDTPHQDERIPHIGMRGMDTPQQHGNPVKGIIDRTGNCPYNARQQVKAGDQ